MTLNQAAAIERAHHYRLTIEHGRINRPYFTMELHLCGDVQSEAVMAALAGNPTFDLSAMLPSCNTQNECVY